MGTRAEAMTCRLRTLGRSASFERDVVVTFDVTNVGAGQMYGLTHYMTEVAYSAHFGGLGYRF